MMLSLYITPVLLYICANKLVGCLPEEHGAEGMRKRETQLYHEEIPRCVINNEGGLPVKISTECRQVLHQALFPDEPSSLNDENGVRKITSEEGLYWLWGILGEDCDVLEELLSTMAVLIAENQTDEPQSWKEIQDIATNLDAVNLREARFQSKRKRDRQTQTTVDSFPKSGQDIFNQHLTATELARLNNNLPTNPPPGRAK
ncbi:uncharacterized protein LOC117296515 [Asterias rubens]|uniref:uncharacterized protein LOC117296515 n=1 Tax=Asterias rubens TaxID=7604 RepID=UPI0014552A84|nr:uncharacterized protein LOC117296515 [Asterias rubens]